MLVDVFAKGVKGKEAETALDRAYITANKNTIPFDVNPPLNPSGMRFGSPAVTTRGIGATEMQDVAAIDRDRARKRLERGRARRSSPQGGGADRSFSVVRVETRPPPVQPRRDRIALPAESMLPHRHRRSPIWRFRHRHLHPQSHARASRAGSRQSLHADRPARGNCVLPGSAPTLRLRFTAVRNDGSAPIICHFRDFLQPFEADLFHIPLNSVAWWMPKPYVVTIHDMGTLAVSGPAGYPRNLASEERYRRGALRACARHHGLAFHAPRHRERAPYSRRSYSHHLQCARPGIHSDGARRGT